MTKQIDPVEARQARQGRPVLIILAVSMALAFIAAWVMWGTVSERDSTAYLNAGPTVFAGATE
jgi:hypothetical protein